MRSLGGSLNQGLSMQGLARETMQHEWGREEAGAREECKMRLPGSDSVWKDNTWSHRGDKDSEKWQRVAGAGEMSGRTRTE